MPSGQQISQIKGHFCVWVIQRRLI